MTIHVAQFQKKYTAITKRGSFRSTVPISGPTMVLDLGPEDLPEIDRLESWASKANQVYIGRGFEGGSSYWGGIKSLDELRHLLERGWPEGTEKILRLADKIRDGIPHPAGSRRVIQWGDQGDSIDMAKVYSGNLDRAWRSSPRQRQRAPRVISIDVDVGQNCNVGADDLFWSGAAAVALTDALEDAGYRVELFATSSTNFSGNVGISRFRAKEANEPLNPSLVAAFVAHPATFRWYHLMSWLKHPVRLGWGFGQSAALPAILEAAMAEGVIEGAEVTMDNSLSEAEAIKEVTAAIERLTEAEETAEGTMR